MVIPPGDGYGGAVTQLVALFGERDIDDPEVMAAFERTVARIRSAVAGLNEKRDPEFADRPMPDPDEFVAGVRAAVLEPLSQRPDS